MILCVTPNAAIDRTLVVPGFGPGSVFRPVETIVAAGGKGINVARAVRALGGQSTCAGFLGGHSGRLLATLAEREGLEGIWTWVEGESRTCVIIVDPTQGQATVVNEHGLTVTADNWRDLCDDVLRLSGHSNCVCLSGSLPPGVSPDQFVGLIRALGEAGATVWVDTSGEALQAALTVESIALKVNGDEAGALLNGAVSDVKAAAGAADELRKRGAREVVITLGAEGAVLACESGRWRVRPPTIKAVSAVASGDCFLAGLILALTSGASHDEALKRAVAAGAANTLTVGGGRFSLEDFERIRGETYLEAL